MIFIFRALNTFLHLDLKYKKKNANCYFGLEKTYIEYTCEVTFFFFFFFPFFQYRSAPILAICSAVSFSHITVLFETQ